LFFDYPVFFRVIPMPIDNATLTHRDKIKAACLNYLIECGCAEEEMTDFFKQASAAIRAAVKPEGVKAIKEAGIIGTSAMTAALLALLGIAVPSAAGAALGNQLGTTAGNIQAGQVPTEAQLELTDELAAYERNTDEILSRMNRRKEKEALRSKPSVRRMF
jgi:hypothetical protein